MVVFMDLTSTAVKAQFPPCSEYLFLSKVVSCRAPIRLHWAAHFSPVHCHWPALHTLGGSRVKQWNGESESRKKKTGKETQETLLTRCCTSAVFCPLSGMCAYGGNKDNLLFLDIVLGGGKDLVDTHSPRHTLLCTVPWLQQAQVAGETHSLGDRRTRSLKTPDLWDTHDLEGQKTEWVEESGPNHYHTYFCILQTLQCCWQSA